MSYSSKTSGVRPNFIFSNESLEYLECLEKKNLKIYPEEKKLEFFEGPRVFSPKIGRFLKILKFFFVIIQISYDSKKVILSHFLSRHICDQQNFFSISPVYRVRILKHSYLFNGMVETKDICTINQGHMKVSNDDTFTGKFNLGGITLVDFSRKVPVK